MPSILLITSDGGARAGLASVFGMAGWRVQEVPTGSMGSQAFRGSLPDAVVVDQSLPDIDGLTIVGDLRRIAKGRGVVIAALVEEIDRATAVQYVKAGTNIFLAKPIDVADAYARIAGKIEGAPPLEPPSVSTDPLAKPVVLMASPSLNARDTAIKVLSDEYEVVHFDGAQGISGERKQAAVTVLDEGLAGGLGTLPSIQAMFGESPVLALVGRGNEVPAHFAATLTKPLRSTQLARYVREVTDRVDYGLSPMDQGVVVRLRDGWEKLEDAAFEQVVEQIRDIATLVEGSGRTWICLTGPYVGSGKLRPRCKALLEAVAYEDLKVGMVTSQSNTVKVAHDHQLHPKMVHQSTTAFIKAVGELV